MTNDLEKTNLESSKGKVRSVASSATAGSATFAFKPKEDPNLYLKPRPKTDFYLLFALGLLFMTMVFM